MEKVKSRGAPIEFKGKWYQEVVTEQYNCEGCAFEGSQGNCTGPECCLDTLFIKVENQDGRN